MAANERCFFAEHRWDMLHDATRHKLVEMRAREVQLHFIGSRPNGSHATKGTIGDLQLQEHDHPPLLALH